MMKIAVIAHVRHPIAEPFAGGLEAHTAALVSGLGEAGHDVTLFGAQGGTCAHEEPFCKPTHNLTDDEFAYEHNAYQNLMQTLAKRDFDIIHNNSLHYLTIGMAGLLPVPMVTTLHTPPFWEMTGAMRLAPHPNNHFVAVSDSIGALWAAHAPSRTIANGIDLQRFAYHPTPATPPYLIWSGRIVPEKGLHLAIAAAALAGLPLLIAGPIADDSYFATEIRPHLGTAATYLGHLNHGDLVARIGAATACLCTPMWDEPYGLVVAEALACGTPVAAFARGAIPALLNPDSGTLAIPGDAADLARAAIAAAGLPRAGARARAAEIGDGTRMITAYAALYEQLRAHPHPPLTSPPQGLLSVTSRDALRALYAA